MFLVDVIICYKKGEFIFYYVYNFYWIFVVLKLGEDVVWLIVFFIFLLNNMVSLSEKDMLVDGKNFGFLRSK